MAQPADELIIDNIRAVLPDRILAPAWVSVQGDRIASVAPGPAGRKNGSAMVVDGEGALLLPGIVDLHSDALEHFIEPEPGLVFSLPLAITEFDKILVGCGITTMFHCVALAIHDNTDQTLRSEQAATNFAEELVRLRPGLLARTRIHVRYDLVNRPALPALHALIDKDHVDLISLMDHTPGTGQHSDVERYRERRARKLGCSLQEVDDYIARRQRAQQAIDQGEVRQLSAKCAGRGVVVATHDDWSEERVRWGHGIGSTVSDFPVNLPAIEAARECGMTISMGSPNLVRGRSQAGNISVRDVVAAGNCDVLCSDYAPMTMLHAPFIAASLGLATLPAAVAMVSLNAARAVGRQNEMGSLEPGKLADMVLVDDRGEVPRVLRTFVGGRQVFSSAPPVSESLSRTPADPVRATAGS